MGIPACRWASQHACAAGPGGSPTGWPPAATRSADSASLLLWILQGSRRRVSSIGPRAVGHVAAGLSAQGRRRPPCALPPPTRPTPPGPQRGRPRPLIPSQTTPPNPHLASSAARSPPRLQIKSRHSWTRPPLAVHGCLYACSKPLLTSLSPPIRSSLHRRSPTHDGPIED